MIFVDSYCLSEFDVLVPESEAKTQCVMFIHKDKRHSNEHVGTIKPTFTYSLTSHMSSLQTRQQINNTSLIKTYPKGQKSKIIPIPTRTWAGRPRIRGSILSKE